MLSLAIQLQRYQILKIVIKIKAVTDIYLHDHFR